MITAGTVIQININYTYSHSKMVQHRGEPDKEPDCPYCYNGKIKEDRNVPNIFFCDACLREVTIRKFDK